ncbi:MAG: c-type cytochrome [Pirellulales bacterium]|nr:c-type cytochrome [Pirellulales bacterium]
MRFAVRMTWCLAAVATSAALAQEVPLVAPTEALPPEQQRQMFHLPPGFEIQLVAAEPEVHKPMNLRFDHRGRMYVTQSVEYPYPAADDAPKRDEIRRYSEFGPDGHAGKIETIVSGLNIPIGVLPTSAGLLYYSIPQVSLATDTDGDDVPDHSEPFVGTFGFRDTHGMCSSLHRGLDGWVYATHGFANTSEVAGSDGQKIVMNSGNTFRMKLDGTHCEQLTHGQVNPFGLCFDPRMNLYSADCHSMPVYMLLRGAYYPSFGKPHDGLGFGPQMIRHLHGSTGIAGVVYYAADHFPASYRDTLFIGNPVTGRINHDRLAQTGSTFDCVEQPDFISCDDLWFRPVDVQLGPDGALYILDFYNCIIGHYEVPLTHPRRDRERGRIWRVVYKGDDPTSRPLAPLPDITSKSADELIALLRQDNLELRTMATHELVDRIGSAAIAPARAALEHSTPDQRAHLIWVLERLGALDGTTILRLANDGEPVVRIHLIKALSERADWTAAGCDVQGLVLARLHDGDAFVARAAAEALGRHPRLDQLGPLLEAWSLASPQDTHLVHVIRMAARDHLLLPEAFAEARRLAEGNPQRFGQVADLSLGVASAEAAAFVLDYLQSPSGPRDRLDQFLQHAAQQGPPEQFAAACGFAEGLQATERGTQQLALRALQRAAAARGLALTPTIRTWATRLGNELLTASEEGPVREGIDLARELGLAELFDALAALTESQPLAALRPAAVDACVAIDGHRAVGLLARLLASSDQPLDLRQKAAQALGAVGNDAAREALLAQLSTAPERLAIEIAAALAANRPGAEGLLAVIQAGKASPRLLQELNVENRLRAAGVPELDAQLQQLTSGLPPRDERVRQLIDQRREGFHRASADVAAGQAVFKQRCAACHRLGGEGTKIGPELDGIGQRGLDRLLEDVLSPSTNVDQAFRSTLVATTDGRSLSGLALREEGQVLVLADAEGKEVRVALDDIDERSATPLSPMPGNLADLVPEADFYHLFAFLLSQKQPPAKP